MSAKKIVPTSDKPRQRKRLVCGGTIVSRAILSRSASFTDGWKAAADPFRFAIHLASTTRLRTVIPWPKLAVGHL